MSKLLVTISYKGDEPRADGREEQRSQRWQR